MSVHETQATDPLLGNSDEISVQANHETGPIFLRCCITLWNRYIHPIISNRRTIDIFALFVIFIILALHWLFFGIVFAREGVQLNNYHAKVVNHNPQRTNFIITQVGIIVQLIVGALFSYAVVRFAQERITSTRITVYHVFLVTGFKSRGLLDVAKVITRHRWLPAVPLLAYILAFINVPSGTTSLITPIPFNRTVDLEGTEINFSSNATDCLEWLNGHNISKYCDWLTYNDMVYTSCLGGNQMDDAMESGRGHILSLLPNNSESLTLGQLLTKDGLRLRIFGPIRGVLPMGPNGIPVFDTFKNSPFSDRNTKDGMLSYDYTLEQQGLISNISCVYDRESPVRYGALPDSTRFALQYNGTCDGKADVLTGVIQFIIPNGNSTLGFWACGSPSNGPQDPSYFVYLRGRGFYQAAIGNITCTISPIKPATFPVTYQSQSRIFSVKESTSVSPATYPRLIENTLVALGDIVQKSQNSEANLVAESVITFGARSFKLPLYVQDQRYLLLYEALIQGILEYEATYSRLIYSTATDLPRSCLRTVKGSVTYRTFGWHTTLQNVAFLLPITLINLVSCFIIAMTAVYTPHGSAHDPTDPEKLLSATRIPAEGENVTDKVVYRLEEVQDQLELSEKRAEKPEAPTPPELGPSRS